MRNINAVVIDDERSAVHSLRGMLEEYCPMVNIIAAAHTVEQGVKVTRQYKPGIVFLDIEITPNGNGFDFLRQTEDCEYGLIFTTAHAQYAIQAINMAQPLAYLVKPYRVPELVYAIHKAALKNSKSGNVSDPIYRGIILGDMRKGNIVLRHVDIIFCHSDGPCTDFYVNRDGVLERYAFYRSLRELEKELPARLFYRTHQSYLVNMSYIHRFERRGRSGTLHFSFDLRAEVSQQKLEPFSRQFHAFINGTLIDR